MALRHNVTGYDPTYVALAEAVEATDLLTPDGRPATAPGIGCRITVV